MKDADRLEVSRIRQALNIPCSAIYVDRQHRDRIVRLQDTDRQWLYSQIPTAGICGIPTVFYDDGDPRPTEGPWKSVTLMWMRLSDGVIPMTVVEVAP